MAGLRGHVVHRHHAPVMLLRLAVLAAAAIAGLASATAPPQWLEFNNTNALVGSASKERYNHTHVAGKTTSPQACWDSCVTNASCTIWSWSPNTHNCYWRLDGTWQTTSSAGYVSGCQPNSVWGCNPIDAPCPSHVRDPDTQWPPAPNASTMRLVSLQHDATTTVVSDQFRGLGVNFDFWPDTKGKWGTCGALNSALEDPQLLTLARRLNGSLLRMGGSPADFLLYDVTPDACSQQNLNRTQQKTPSGYFCPIWDQVQGQCLTMDRWAVINNFARAAGFHIAFDLNACWGRMNSTSAMDMTLIQGLFDATAKMAAKGNSAVFAFQFGNELYSNVEQQRYGSDILELSSMIADTWQRYAPDAVQPVLVGPDNGGDMSAEHLEGILNVSAPAMYAATYHAYGGEDCVGADVIPPHMALNASCSDVARQQLTQRYAPVTSRFNATALWVSEGAMHASSGIQGVTNTFRSTLWYVHTLAALREEGVAMFSRQTLLGGDYELINRTTGLPNPDYWGAVLWHNLVGRGFQNLTAGEGCDAACQENLRFHAMSDFKGDGVVFIVVNFHLAVGYELSVQPASVIGGNLATTGSMYQLTGQPHSNHIFFNGNPIVSPSSDLPPRPQPASSPWVCPPSSVSFFHFPADPSGAPSETP